MNKSVLEQLGSTEVDVVPYIEETEIDEMWSFVGSKKQHRPLWHAIDHQTGQVLAYVLAPHTDAALIQLQALLAPFGIEQFYTDNWGADSRYLESSTHTIGKANTQKIERKHLTLRTRMKRTPLAERSAIARKTICFSKSIWLHDVVIGLFINRYEFGRAI